MAYKQKGWSPYTKKDCNYKKSSAMKAYDVKHGQDIVEAKNQALAARGGLGSAGAKFALSQG